MATMSSNSASFGLFSAPPPNPAPGRPAIISTQEPVFTSDLSLAKRLQMIREREGEDAVLTGGTRSLHRRLLALNVGDVQRLTSTRASLQSQPRPTVLSA